MSNYSPNSDEGVDQGNFSPFSEMSRAHSFGTTINQRQMDWLLRHMSTEEMAELARMTGQCARQCAVSYGGPIAACSIGFLEFLRRKQMRPLNSPRYIIGYPFMVLTSALLGSSMGIRKSSCGIQTQLYLEKLYTKYDSQIGEAKATKMGVDGAISSSKTFAQLREANRTGRSTEAAEQLKQQRRQRQPPKGQQQQQTVGTSNRDTDIGRGTGTDGTGTDEWGSYGLEGVFAPSSPPAPSSDDGSSSSPFSSRPTKSF